MKWTEVDKKLRDLGIKIFSDQEFRNIANLSPTSAKFLLIRYTKRGLFVRLKKGLYAIENRLPPTFMIANRLYQPSYISMETALSYYGLIPETVYSITSITTKPTREFEALNISYVYHAIKKQAFTGYRLIPISNEKVLMAEREKCLADYLYFVYLGRKPLNDRLIFRNIKKSLLVFYLKTFNNQNLLRWFKHDFRIPNS